MSHLLDKPLSVIPSHDYVSLYDFVLYVMTLSKPVSHDFVLYD